MPLTLTQGQALKAAILANPTWAEFPLSDDGYFDLARALDAPAAPNFWVWSTNVDLQVIKDAIIWANLTPADVPDGTQAWANRSLQCQGKQFNLQLVLPVTGTYNAANLNTRAGIQDALTGVRSGVAGASQAAGWAAVQGVLARRSTHFEKILADTALGNGSTKALSSTMVVEGRCQPDDVRYARSL